MNKRKLEQAIAKQEQLIEDDELVHRHSSLLHYHVGYLDGLKEALGYAEPNKSVRKLWEEFGNVPVNNNDEIDQDFYHFEKGTPKEDVWHWFEELDPTFSVGEMLNGPKS